MRVYFKIMPSILLMLCLYFKNCILFCSKLGISVCLPIEGKEREGKRRKEKEIL